MNDQSKELLRDAYAIVDGIPDEAVRLGVPCLTRGPALESGTVCSPAGWLAQHPQFIARGLTLSDAGVILFEGQGADTVAEAVPMALVFDLTAEEAQRIFAARSELAQGADDTLSDKQLWQQRVRELLGAGTPAAAPEAAATAEEAVA